MSACPYLAAEFKPKNQTFQVWFFGLSYAMDGIVRNETLIETDVAAIFANCFRLERTNQLNLLPDKDLVDLYPLSNHTK